MLKPRLKLILHSWNRITLIVTQNIILIKHAQLQCIRDMHMNLINHSITALYNTSLQGRIQKFFKVFQGVLEGFVHYWVAKFLQHHVSTKLKNTTFKKIKKENVHSFHTFPSLFLIYALQEKMENKSCNIDCCITLHNAMSTIEQ